MYLSFLIPFLFVQVQACFKNCLPLDYIDKPFLALCFSEPNLCDGNVTTVWGRPLLRGKLTPGSFQPALETQTIFVS